jgi:Protein of unknown function (DUF4054)
MAAGADIAAFRVAIPEFAAMTDQQLSAALDETDMWLEAGLWHPPDFVWARWYLTAHNIKMALGIGGTAGSGSGGSTEISSDLFVRMVAFGERRVMFGERKVSTTEGQITGPGSAEFDDTIYGQKFLRLRSRNIPPILTV